jgi:hypothetical protein
VAETELNTETVAETVADTVATVSQNETRGIFGDHMLRARMLYKKNNAK